MFGLTEILSGLNLCPLEEFVRFVPLAVGLVSKFSGFLSERLGTILGCLQRLGCHLLRLSRHRLQILKLCLSQHDLRESCLGRLLGFLEKTQRLLLHSLGVGDRLITVCRSLRREGIRIFLCGDLG